MSLTLIQIQEILRKPKKKEVIERAIRHQERIRFHTEVALDQRTTSAAFTEFLEFVATGTDLPEDKLATFIYLVRFPVKTVKETDRIFKDLSKVFDGQNPVYKYEFTSSELHEDWMDFITDEQIANRWRTDGIKKMRLAINSILIVDIPKEQTEKRPRPYFYFLDICHVLDFQTNKDGFDWIIFRQDEKTAIVIDETSYKTIYYENDPDKISLIDEAPHDLEYCPAKFFWSEYLNDQEPDIKLSPITTNLGDLDWLLFFMIAKQHLDSYAGYPIYSGFERDCDFEYEDKLGIVTCDRGFLKDQGGHYILQGDKVAKCPVCSNKRLRGPGTFFEIPKPGPENDNADMRNPVQITTVDRYSLEYNTKEADRLKREIQQNVTGYASEPNTEQAMNVKQIMAAFESRTAVLRDLKKNFEQAMEWVDYTLAKIRYGADFLSCYIDLGTDFYLYESQYLLDLYHTAKEAEADGSILDALLDQYYTTRYRNSPDQLKREQILKHLDPVRHVSINKATELYEKGMLNYPDFVVKLKFITFVNRFERDNAPLIEFGEYLPFDERINAIKKIIYSYVERPDFETNKALYLGKPASGGAGTGSPANGGANGSTYSAK